MQFLLEQLEKHRGEIVAALAAFVVALVRELRKRSPTQTFKRNKDELDAIGEREIEVVVAAEEFSKDVELERRAALIVELTLENRQLKAQNALLEEGKLDLEMREAEARVALKRVTGTHRALPDQHEETTAPMRGNDVITERPRARRVPPPVPKLPAGSPAKGPQDG